MVRFAHRSFSEGAVAQLVEQRTENPCVAGSIPAHTTESDYDGSCSRFCFEYIEVNRPELLQ